MGAFSGFAGLFRFITIVIGIIDFGITVDSFLHHYELEEFFLAVVIITLVVSCLIVLALSVGLFEGQDWANKFDISFHVLAAIFLLIGGICMLVSVSRFGVTYSRNFYLQRIWSGILGLINAFVYAIIIWFLLRN